MSKTLILFGNILFFSLFVGCDSHARHGGKLSQPTEAHIDLSEITLNQFKDDLRRVLFRYLASNPRWEIRLDRGVRFAVRLEQINGNYEPTLNGYYSKFENGNYQQSRVLISFDRAYGFGDGEGISRAKPGEQDVPITIEGPHSGSPGNTSYTIVEGNSIFLEIYEQDSKLSRTFTQNTYKELSSEFEKVIEYRSAVEECGIIPIPKLYPIPAPKKASFEITDGIQPGIYKISASTNPTEPGIVYLKIYDVNSGKRLSAERVTPRSTRFIGWSDNGNTFYLYSSEVTIYEGDWSIKYEARFELWHQSDSGTEKKLAEMSRMINGWQR